MVDEPSVPASLSSDTVKFRVGGEDIDVPALSFWGLKRAKPYLINLDRGLDWIDFGENVMEVLAVALEGKAPKERFSAEALERRCSIDEARALSGSMTELLRLSGFLKSGEAETQEASPGTGTSTSSSPSSPSEASAEATPSASSEP